MAPAITVGCNRPPLLTVPSATVLCAVVFLHAPGQAAEAPLWVAGFGIGVLGYSDYRGADSTHVFPVPVPYFEYNGPFLKADQEGLHGSLFKQPWVELNLSADATMPVSNDRTRNGMTQLKPTVEAGISLDFHLWRSEDSRIKLDLRVPVREAFTLQAPPQAIGVTLTPGFRLTIADPLGYGGWKAGIYTGPLFANGRYNNYFYSVAPQNATASRPAYQSESGYAGTQLVFDLSKRFPKYWIGAFVRFDTLAGAVFADSPLVQDERYWAAGFVFAWMIGRSSQMVEVSN